MALVEGIRTSSKRLVGALRSRIIGGATSPFRHAPYPLADTLQYRDDPGLLGPRSVSWSVIGDVAAFVGGIRGLLIQAAHPEVVAGIGDHSRYREDPLGRLSRTSAYVTATTYGAMPEVDRAVEMVTRRHSPVVGISARGIEYKAGDPGLAAWVHNALTDSFLTAHQKYGATPLSDAEADRFVEEQANVGELLGADPLPRTMKDLASWITDHPDVAPSPQMQEAIDFLTDPPLEPALKAGYKVLLEAAVTTIPPRIRTVLGVSASRGAAVTGRLAMHGLRWALGYSPTWKLALERTNSPIPDGLFTQDVTARVG